jgi:streptogramin lyase
MLMATWSPEGSGRLASRKGRSWRQAGNALPRWALRFRPEVERLETRVVPALRGGFNSSALTQQDDSPSVQADLGFTADFFGTTETKVWVNNNGNITFDGAQSAYTPYGLTGTSHQIIAPFFADVDTRGAGTVTAYGQGTVDGHNAFGVTWNGVDYFNATLSDHQSKLDRFQVVLIDQSVAGQPATVGSFDIEFNYDTITWETGNASGGSNGLGGSSAHVGYANGSTASYEFPGSGTPGSFLDGGPHALASGGNTGVTGRYLFAVRNGQVDQPLTPGVPLQGQLNEGDTYNGFIATFTDGDPNGTATQFQGTTIDWGDGQTTPADFINGTPGNFQVHGTHQYKEAGTFPTKVHIVDSGGSTADVNGMMTVNDALLAVVGDTPVHATEGTPYTADLLTFNDTDTTDTPAVPGNFTVQVNWGDGSAAETIVPTQPGGPGTPLHVAGAHPFMKAGNLTVHVTITDNEEHTPQTINDDIMASIDDAALSVTMDATPPTGLVVGQAFTSHLAVFTDADVTKIGHPENYRVTVDWGDNQTSTLGDGSLTFTPTGNTGAASFDLGGTHTYQTAGPKTITITVADLSSGSTPATAGGTAAVTVIAPQGHITFDIIQPVDGTNRNIGFVDASTKLDGRNTRMDASFFLDPAYNYCQGCFTFHWLQVVTNITANATLTFHTTPVPNLIPLIDPPRLGYDPLPSDDALPWYFNATEELAANKTTALGSKIFSMDDTPTVTGASFDTWLVAEYTSAQGSAFSVLGGFHWNQGTLGDPSTLAQNGAPDLNAIRLAMQHARFGDIVSANVDLGCHGLVFQCPDPPLDVARGVPLPASVVVSTFTDTIDPHPAATDFTATINWGDGVVEPATITQIDTQMFNITTAGTHVYNQIGPFTYTVTVTQISGTMFQGTCPITVHNLAAAGLLVNATEGETFDGPVAVFADSNPAAQESDFTISINWGDGVVDSGMAQALGGGVFAVIGTHTYAEQDIVPVTVSILDTDGDTATANSGALIVDAPLNDVGTPTTYTVREGDVARNYAVATFTDDNTLATVDDFTATINWGDGTPDTVGFVQRVPNSSTQFEVLGTHQYADESPGAAPFVVTVTIDDEGGAAAGNSTVVTANTQFVVTDAPLEPNAATVTPTEGVSFTGVVGTFVDESPTGLTSDFEVGTMPGVVSINWGDGTPPTLGTVGLVLQDQASVHFNVTGTHTYAEQGSFPITISILDDGGTMATLNSTANVADAPLVASGIPGGLSLTEGASFSGVVATFTDVGSDGTTNDYSASINWGDNTPPSTASIGMGAGGVFTIAGSHVFEEGSTNITVTLRDNGGSMATPITRVTVADAALSLGTTTTPPVTPFTLGTPNSFPQGIISGPGGFLWLLESNTRKLGRIDPTSGAIVEFPLPDASDAHTGLTAGPDGNIWIVETNLNKIARFVPSTGVLTEFVVPTSNSLPTGIAAGPDGNLWFTERTKSKIGRLNPATGAITELPVPNSNVSLFDIVAGPDGNLWFAENGFPTSFIARITPAGVVTEFPLPTLSTSDIQATPDGLTTGPDGNLWFTELEAGKVGRITPAGTITEFSVSATSPNLQGITRGPDGNVWFTDYNNNLVERITPAGTITPFTLPTADSRPRSITAGPDGNLWVTEDGSNGVARFALNAAPPAGSGFSAVEGVSTTGVLMTFTDANPSAPVGDFTATITWGDGTTSTGTVAASGSAWNVRGTHTYAEEGSFPLSVVVKDVGGSTVSGSLTAAVADAPLTVTASSISSAAGGVFTGLVGVLTDANAAAAASDFTVTIAWGDGHTSLGQLVPLGNGRFEVHGSNVYGRLGSFALTLSVHDRGGSTGTAAGGASVGLPHVSVKPGTVRRRGGRFQQTVTLRNDGNETLQGPLSLVLRNLNRRIKLLNKTNVTSSFAPAGSPYINMSVSLAPGASTSVVLFFSSPTSRISYTTQVLAGNGPR